MQHEVIIYVQIQRKNTTEEHVITIGTIQKINNIIHIGTLTNNDKTISMRTRKP